MIKYKISVHTHLWQTVEVEAEDFKEALENLKSGKFSEPKTIRKHTNFYEANDADFIDTLSQGGLINMYELITEINAQLGEMHPVFSQNNTE